MTNITFLTKKFETERERNAYAFQNKDTLLAERNYTIAGPLIGGFIMGVIFGIWKSSWFIFWGCTIATPILLNLTKYFDKKKIEEYSNQYEQFLVKTEKEIRKEIIEPYNKRYFTADQKGNLINKKDDVLQILKDKFKITEENGKLAVWLSEEKTETLANVEKNDNEVEVLVFKQAIALGWVAQEHQFW